MAEKDKPLKDNAGRDLKPKEAARSNHAPVGSVGTKAPAPGLGNSGITHSQSSLSNATPERSKTSGKEGVHFKETGDQEVDRFYSKSHKMTGKSDNEKDPSDDRER